MSDFYLCEHDEKCCATCVTGAEVEVDMLRVELETERRNLNRYRDSLAQEQARGRNLVGALLRIVERGKGLTPEALIARAALENEEAASDKPK